MHKSNALTKYFVHANSDHIGKQYFIIFFRPLKTTWITVTIKLMTLSHWSVANCPSRTVLLWEPLWYWMSMLEMSSQASSERKSATTLTLNG